MKVFVITGNVVNKDNLKLKSDYEPLAYIEKLKSTEKDNIRYIKPYLGRSTCQKRSNKLKCLTN